MAGIGFPFRDRARFTTVPDAGGGAGGLVLAVKTATAETPSETFRFEFYDASTLELTGTAEWTLGETANELWRLNRDAGGFVELPDFGEKVKRYNAAGALTWQWDNGNTAVSVGMDSVSTADGLWVLRPPNDGGVLALIDAEGVAQATHSVVGTLWSSGYPVSVAASTDGSVLFLLGTDGALKGMSAADGSQLWSVSVSDVGDTPLSAADRFTVRTVPGSNVIICATATEPVENYRTGTVTRLDFSGAATSAPSVTWTDDVDDVRIDFNRYVTSLLVTEDAVFAGCFPSRFNSGDSHHNLIRFDLDGNVEWLHLAGTADAWVPYSSNLALVGDRLIVGIAGNSVTFPTEWWGFVVVTASTGVEASVGDFPLEKYLVYGCVALGGAEALTTWDGLPLTTWDGEQLETWEES